MRNSGHESNGNFGIDAAAGTDGVLHAGAVETRYRRAGVGPAVLLLGDGDVAESRYAELFRALATRCRVTASVLPAGIRNGAREAPAPVSFSSWLRGLMDGLGLERASIVVDRGLAVLALAFAAAERDCVERLVLLSSDEPDPWVGDDVSAETLQRAGYDVLVVRTGGEPAPGALQPATAAVVAAFLTGAPTPRPLVAMIVREGRTGAGSAAA